MPITRDNMAHQYAERILGRLPRALQGSREAVPMSKYALERESGVSRDRLGELEAGEGCENPTLHLLARVAHGLKMKLWEFVKMMDE